MDSVGFARIFGLLFGLALAQQLGQAVPDAAQEQRAEEILERHERIVDAQQNGRQLKVHQKDDDAKVDEGVRRRNELRLFVQHEDDGRDDRRFCVAVGCGRDAGREVEREREGDNMRVRGPH